MKPLLLIACLSLLSSHAVAADVGVSISVGEPGFYGRLDIGNYPPPRLIYAEPIWVQRAVVVPEPIYLVVPPGHAKHWAKHCHEYYACGQRVYFIEDSWYQTVYVPQYREQHGHHGKKHGHKDKHH